MMIALDSHYTIGRLHWYCQDYLFQGGEPFPHVILSDGCSASPNSDIGARLLVLNARRELARFARVAADEAQRAALHWRLGRRIVRRAARQAHELGLNPEVLDATLLIAWCDGTMVRVHLYGDGCIVTRRADGQLTAIQVDYAENAPYYLSYLLDPARNVFYQEAIGDSAVAQSISTLRGPTEVIKRHEPFDNPLVFSFDLADFPLVAVATDGLGSFVEARTQQRVPLWDVLPTVLNFSRYEDTFVREHLEKALAELGERFMFNVDDISLGIFARKA
ncbi:MAG: protein phosphatase 2C domain-containing protein [Candidatus Competibacter denitrificans]|jgi:hypothetical protein